MRPQAHLSTPVLIVGGSAPGLLASLLLSHHGVDHILVEQRESPSTAPRSHILNQRSMEIFRDLGLAEAIYAIGADLTTMSRTAWYTSFAGPSPLHAREVGSIDSWGGGTLAAAYEAASPCHVTNLPQPRLERLLRDRTRELSPSHLLFGHQLIGLEPRRDMVGAIATDLATGRQVRIDTTHVVVADGGETVAARGGLAPLPDHGLVSMVSAHFSADLGEELPDPGVLIYRFVNPDSPGFVHRGTLVQMGGRGWGRDCTEWVFNFAATPDQKKVELGEAEIADRLRTMLGLPELVIKLHGVRLWQVQGVVAPKYQRDKVFLVGNAAHRHPAAGGLGLNVALQDAHNIAWKLAAVHGGWAGAELLDTYESERRPVALNNTAHALRSFFQNRDVDRALGFDTQSTTPAQGWAQLASLFSSTSEGHVLRARVQEAVRSKRYAYQALALEVGYSYSAGALIPDDSWAPGYGAATFDPVCDYIPSTQPGSRLPHVWIDAEAKRVSTIDLTGGRRFVLLVGSRSASWRRAVSHALATTPQLPLDVAQVGHGRGHGRHTWEQFREVDEDGAVLVRPDHHVAWRAMHGPTSKRELSDILLKLLSLPTPSREGST